MTYARIVNDVAVDVVPDVETRFHPDIAAQFVSVPDDVKQGSRLVDGVWTAPPPPPPPEPEEVQEPTPVDPTPVSSDAEAVMKAAQAAQAAAEAAQAAVQIAAQLMSALQALQAPPETNI